MECNKVDEEARKLLYVDFPKFYVWKSGERKWTKRKQGQSIGRIHHVPPNWGEMFYLRIMQNKIKGLEEFDDLKKLDKVVYLTYKEACNAMGLLEDDKEYIDGLKEISTWGTGDYVRTYFVMLMLSETMSHPDVVWEKTWKLMAEDVLEREQVKHKNTELDLSDVQRYNICLTYIEDMLLSNRRSLKDIPKMPYPKAEYTMEDYNKLIYDELKHDKIKLTKQHEILNDSLTKEQKTIYATVMEACNTNSPGMFFIYGYGGTGKTYLYKTLSAAIRSKGEIVLNVASSGIAALLLEGGRTTHYRFAIPINIVEDSMCAITDDSDLAELIQACKLIIWDEAPMMHRHCFEALDRTLRDILDKQDVIFGEKVVVFGRDFRQILPVVTNGTRHDIVHASLNSSKFWNFCNVLKLTVNMRLQGGKTDKELEDTKRFAQWILDIGDGKVGGKNDGESVVEFETDMLIADSEDHVRTMINDVYPDLMSNLWNHTFFSERAILAPTHEQVDKINERMMLLLPGAERHFYSSDTVCAADIDDTFDESVYTTEFLNTIKMSGIPNHHLTLKVGTPVMCLRNIDQRS